MGLEAYFCWFTRVYPTTRDPGCNIDLGPLGLGRKRSIQLLCLTPRA